MQNEARRRSNSTQDDNRYAHRILLASGRRHRLEEVTFRSLVTPLHESDCTPRRPRPVLYARSNVRTPTDADGYERKFLLAQADAMLLSALPEEKLHHVINIADLHGSPQPYAKWQALKTSATPGTYAGRQTARNKVRGITMGSSTVEEYSSNLESLILRVVQNPRHDQ